MTKLWKILVLSGGILLALGIVGLAGCIYTILNSIHTNESAGIGAVDGGIMELAFIGVIVTIIGFVFLVAGVVIKRTRTGDNGSYK